MIGKYWFVILILSVLVISSCQGDLAGEAKFPLGEGDSDRDRCIVDYSQIDGNLVQNPYVECDYDGDGDPDNWIKQDENIPGGHILSWVNDPTGGGDSRILITERIEASELSTFGWYQRIDNIQPDTWYEFSVSFATEGLEPNIRDDNGMDDTSPWLGTSVVVRNTEGIVIRIFEGEYFWSTGPDLSDWDEDVWVYRTYETKGFEDWKTATRYFKTPSGADHIEIMSKNWPKGTGYFDNFVLREIENNPEATPFKESGTLEFIQHKGGDYFPITLWGCPNRDGAEIGFSEIDDAGFNTIGACDYNTDVRQLSLDYDLALIVEFLSVFHHEERTIIRHWVNDPDSLIDYQGAGRIKDQVSEWGGFENLLFFKGVDELTCHSTNLGAFAHRMGTYNTLKAYVETNAPGKKLLYNFCGAAQPYTGSPEDTVNSYFPITDVISYTGNLPPAYPSEDKSILLRRQGELTRWSIDKSYESGTYKPVMAFGTGVVKWAGWDGENFADRYVPFNLQRFQVFDQIINGAAGIWFYISSHMDLENQYNAALFNQITYLSQELDSLYDILLEPKFYDEWQVSDDRIDIMMKKQDGKIYLFTANTHHEDLYDVTIGLDGDYNIVSVTALNDVINGDIENPVDRVVPVNYKRHSFTDDFIGDDATSPAGVATPGYAVHVYEIRYTSSKPKKATAIEQP
ncbi:MAG: hypothetical protein ABIE94_01380 [archaeon]